MGSLRYEQPLTFSFKSCSGMRFETMDDMAVFLLEICDQKIHHNGNHFCVINDKGMAELLYKQTIRIYINRVLDDVKLFHRNKPLGWYRQIVQLTNFMAANCNELPSDIKYYNKHDFDTLDRVHGKKVIEVSFDKSCRDSKVSLFNQGYVFNKKSEAKIKKELEKIAKAYENKRGEFKVVYYYDASTEGFVQRLFRYHETKDKHHCQCKRVGIVRLLNKFDKEVAKYGRVEKDWSLDEDISTEPVVTEL